MKVLSASQMRLLEQTAVDKGATYFLLMKKAGNSVAKILIERMNLQQNDNVCILCGKGNNGGDGFVASSYLKENGYNNVDVVLVDGLPRTVDAKAVYSNANINKVAMCRAFENKQKAFEKIDKADFIIDAIYGIGFKGALREDVKEIVDRVNNSNAKVLSVDIPSGVECDTGKVQNGAFYADVTVSFTAYKSAHLLYPSMDYCGMTIIAQVGIDDKILEDSEYLYKTIEDKDVYSSLPKRKISAHKGSCGTLLAVCGSYGMTGAVQMCVKSAMRCGVGLVKAIVPTKIYGILASNIIEGVFIPSKDCYKGTLSSKNISLVIKHSKTANALVVGCGLSQNKEIQQLVYAIMKNVDIPVIIDADGINAIAKHIDILKELKQTGIITPHPKEMARLCKVTVKEIQNNRVEYARKIAQEHKVVVVLKGANTVVANVNGEVSINITGNAGMAKGGSGDVLAGIISSLVAQGIDVYEASKSGVYLHGLAGDLTKRLKGETSMLATDVIDTLPQLFNR